MKYAQIPLSVAIAGVALWAARVDAQTTPAPTSPAPTVLVLRSGQVFEGQVSQVGGTYSVTFPNGEMRFHSSEVEYCCATLQEVYQRKLAAVAPDDLEERLRLAQWCMKQNLWGEAGQELEAIAARQPNHPLLGMLRQRLELLRQPRPTSKPAPMAALPKSNTAELDRLVRGLPDGTMETFAQRVQPVLVNHCATSGCHGPGSTAKFQVLRVSNPQTASRRVTQQNLLATLAMVNTENPAASPLLTVPARPHGQIPAAVFPDPQSPQYRNLQQWVLIATRRLGTPDDALAQQQPGAASIALPGQTVGPARLVGATEPLPPAITLEGSEPIAARRNAAAHRPRPSARSARSSSADSPSLPAKASVAGASTRPNATTATTASDPFDPEVFNRRFSQPAPPTAASQSP